MKKDQLFEIADRQQGYFTALQAQSIGIPRSNFHRRLASGEWIRERRGIYRLVHYPVTDRPELVIYSLWSCDRKGNVQAVCSHETAMDIHELSDVMPAMTHMTVPKGFRRGGAPPKVLHLHFGELDISDQELRPGYRVTRPLKTLIDVAREGRVSPDLIAQGLEQGFQRGLVSRREIAERSSEEVDSLIRIIDDYKI
jgi:predicted transcriptional regulator of viral defense system